MKKQMKKKATTASKPTVASVHSDLQAHNAECHQRWLENYRRLEGIEGEVKAINLQLKAALAVLVVGMGSILATQVF